MNNNYPLLSIYYGQGIVLGFLIVLTCSMVLVCKEVETQIRTKQASYIWGGARCKSTTSGR